VAPNGTFVNINPTMGNKENIPSHLPYKRGIGRGGERGLVTSFYSPSLFFPSLSLSLSHVLMETSTSLYNISLPNSYASNSFHLFRYRSLMFKRSKRVHSLVNLVYNLEFRVRFLTQVQCWSQNLLISNILGRLKQSCSRYVAHILV
jgi:hypothetical protein